MTNSASTFDPPDAQNLLRALQIPLHAKTKFSITCHDLLFMESVPVPPEYEK
jgi:hypothetical protein